MAYHISVHRRSDDPFYRSSPDVSSDAFDRWLKECWDRWLYDAPLGSDGNVFRYWHLPARSLGLPLLGSLYHDGLRVDRHRLAELGRELDVLEEFWKQVGFRDEELLTIHTVGTDGVEAVEVLTPLDHLRERIGYLREAIRIAEGNDGIVAVG